ncbi:MAG: MucB/RseB C-terminal domain-containing protein, partial [Gammaproteobacteria bacterium]|nr:MucB/RseB C-terminal domain-containing protein [Gammaproteobacteria bacterium]
MSRLFSWLPPFILAAMLTPAATAASNDHGASSNNSTEFWLNRMNVALRTLNYQGNFVYIHGNRMETMWIVHRADRFGGLERLVSLTGPEREVIRDHKEVKSIIPESHSVIIERRYASAHLPSPMPSVIHENKLNAYYKFKYLGEDRVAGNICKIISIEPRDKYRYGYRLWLDENNGMLLRSDLLTQAGIPIERVMFTSITYPKSIPDSAFKATELKPGFVWNIQGGIEKQMGADEKVPWKVTELPPGFTLSMNDIQRMADTPDPVRHLVFSDGMASVSVFVEKYLPGHQQLIGPSHMEAINAYGRRIG